MSILIESKVGSFRKMGKEELKSLGETFKQRRKEMNLSLKEVENATSIRMGHLQAIEEGEMHKLISPIYAQGFMKQYASFLGIDGDKIVRENPEIFVRAGVQDFSYGIGTLEVRGNPGAGIKWFPNAIWIGVFVFLLVVAWYLAKFFDII
jgi:cytoskeletal protein RodZ